MKDLILGKIIVTKYCGQTDSKQARILASHKEDRDTTLRCYHNYDDGMSGEENHLAAAKKLLATKWLYDHNLGIVACGSDCGNYYFLAVNRKILPMMLVQAQSLGGLS